MMHRLTPIWYTALPYDILATQAWYNIRSFICRRHISSHDSAISYRRYITRSTRNGYHWKSEPLPVDKSSLFHGASDGNRTRMVSLGSWSSTTELRLQMLELVVRFELTTCWLRISCTAPVLHQHKQHESIILYLPCLVKNNSKEKREKWKPHHVLQYINKCGARR